MGWWPNDVMQQQDKKYYVRAKFAVKTQAHIFKKYKNK